MSSRQTDNSYLADKIVLRLSCIPTKKILNVIDAYNGKGTIWKNIQKKYKGEINVVKIDKEDKSQDFSWIGFNEKYLSAMDLSAFDVIDLDAYGIPFEQLQIVFKGGFHGVVFVTFIQSIMGRLPNEFLNVLGYTTAMINKCPTLFAKKGLKKLYNYLALNGVKKVMVRAANRKAYLAFQV